MKPEGKRSKAMGHTDPNALGARRMAALDHEFAQERAGVLGRLGRRLEAAVRALNDHDAGFWLDPEDRTSAGQRAELVTAAADAYWCFVVQRECCGLFDSAAVRDNYKVTMEVQRHAGLAPAAHPPAAWARWLR